MEYIIHEYWKGFGVWESSPDWRNCNSLGDFSTRQQAEAFEQELLEQERGVT